MSNAKIRWYERALSALLVYLLYFGGYGLVNRRLVLTNCTDLTLAVDQLIPFVAEFVAPFYLAYLVVLAPVFLLTDRRLLGHALISFSVLVALSCIAFVSFPTYVPRPEFTPVSLSEQLVAAIYRADRPCCGFPSLHVSASALSALVLQRQNVGYGRWLWICAAVIAISTLFIKQHVIADVAGGVAAALVVDWAVHAVRSRRRLELDAPR